MLSNYTLYVQLLITHLYFLYLSFYSLSFSFCSNSMKRSLVVRDASNPHLPLFQLHNKPVLRATCKHPMVQVRNVYQLYQLVKEENFPGYDNGKQQNDEKFTNNSFFQGRSPAEPRFTARRGQSREREDATVHAQYTSRNQFVVSY